MRILREIRNLIDKISNYPPSVQHNRGWDYTPEAIRQTERKIDFSGCQRVKLTVIPEGWEVIDGKAVLIEKRNGKAD